VTQAPIRGGFGGLLRISSTSVIERYESLLATQQELKEKERELSNE